MKNPKWLIGIIVCLIMIAGCSQNTELPADREGSEGELQCYHGFEAAIDAETGFYHTSSNGFLYFFDYESKEDMIVCNQPNCRHEEWYEDTPVEERCSAYIGGMTNGFVIGEKLYLLERHGTEPEQMRIVESDLDRTNQREVGVLDCYSIYSYAAKDGILYAVMSQPEKVEQEDGSVMSGSRTKSVLTGVRLSDGEMELLLETEQIGDEIQILGGEGSKLYLEHSYFEKPYDGTNFEDANLHTEYYECDLDTGTIKEILKGEKTFQIRSAAGVNGALFALTYPVAFNGKNDIPFELRKINPDTGESEVLAEMNGKISFFENYALYEKEDGRGCCLYDFQKEEEAAVLKLEYGNNIFTHQAGDYLYGVKYENEEQIGGSLGFFLLSDLMEGKETFYAVGN